MRSTIFRVFAVLAGLTLSAATPVHLPTVAIRVPIEDSSFESAISVRDSEQSLQKRATTAYFIMCENMNFGGRCQVSISPWGLCFTLLDENDDWASSALVSAGSTCTLYWDRLCAGSAYTITSEGILDLYPVGWDNKATSYRCQSA